MDGNLILVARRIEQAAAPEEVFGDLNGCAADRMAHLKLVFRQLAKVAHPDMYPGRDDKKLAQAAFSRLTEWLRQAEAKIQAGLYGSSAGGREAVLTTQRSVYHIEPDGQEAGVFTLYRARLEQGDAALPVTLKTPRDPRDNDLAHNEARILQVLRAGNAAEKFAAYVPGWVESFLFEEGGVTRQVNVFERACGWYSLHEVRAAYPGGIDPKDMAWMWRRLLVALGFAHINGVIHGAVLPGNICILPEQHGLRLENWAFAVLNPQASGEIIAAVDADYEDWYPNEVRNSEPPAAATDIAMSARCMIYLLGGDPVRGAMPARVPAAVQMFLKSCILPGKRARPQEAWGLKEEFDELLQRLWGERKFHPFSMQ
jgi:hypothetical protein